MSGKEKRKPFIRWWDFPAALLLVTAILTAATRLVATQWTVNLSIVQTLVFFGVLAGLALGYSRFSARWTVFFAFAYGLFAIPWQLGIILPLHLRWPERLAVLSNRLQIIISQLFYRETVRDSLLFLVVMFALFWFISVHAGYTLTRHGDAWQAILPAGLAMFLIHSFDPAISRRLWYLAIYLFFSLILVARMTFLHYQNQWQRSRTALPPHISLDFIRYTILATFIIVVFAWTIPALANAVPQARKAWQPVRSAWYDTVSDFQNAFASLRSSIIVYSGIYGSSTQLGRGAIHSDTQMFRGIAPLDIPEDARLYWRARTYDTYDNGKWESTTKITQPYDPVAEADLPVWVGDGRWLGRFRIISASHMATLFAPPQPIWVSQGGLVEYTENPNGTIDISTFKPSSNLTPGESYEILSSISTPSVEQLRRAGEEYPAWITEKYLQLPGSITPRTQQLAEEITAGLETPYDKVIAITNYLRQNIQYVELIEETPPTDQEPIDWFLFDLKKGFCNYYSTAEIVMLRSLGIPARWAAGYAQGELLDDSSSGEPSDELTYIVRQRNAHSWPEVFFPEFGWVEFEPTVSEPEILRREKPADSTDTLTEQEELELLRLERAEQLARLREQRERDAANEAGVDPQKRLAQIIVPLAGAAIFLLFLFFLPYFGLPAFPVLLRRAFLRMGIRPPQMLDLWAEKSEYAARARPRQLPPLPILLENTFIRLRIKPPRAIRLWASQARLPPLSKAYMEINRSLKLFGRPPESTHTPNERATALGRILPPAEKPARDLVAEYQLGTFSRQPADLKLALDSAAAIRRISLQAYLKRLLEKFQKPDRSRQFLRSGSGKNG
jgi:transglutaminase-like putative cysteine protease